MNLLEGLAIFVAWVVVQGWLLPRLGVPDVSGPQPARDAGGQAQGLPIARGSGSRGTSLVLLVTTAQACYLPAHRVARLDPVQAPGTE